MAQETKMDKHEAAQSVADDLFAAELALDQALDHAARLVARAAANRQPMGLALKTGAGSVAKLTKLVDTLAETRVAMAEIHHEFDVVARASGIRIDMTGGGEKNPSSKASASVSQIRAA